LRKDIHYIFSMQEKFRENEIPYTDFERVGFTEKAMFDQFSKEDWERLLAGKRTNIFKVSGVDNQGERFEFEAKFSLHRNADGKVNLSLHPKRTEINNDIGLTKGEIKKLYKGKLVKKKIDGVGYLIQLDNETNELLKTKISEIVLPSIIGGVLITNYQRSRLFDGASIEIKLENNRKMEVRLDLDSLRGLKFTEV